MAKQDFRFFDSRQKYLLFVTTLMKNKLLETILTNILKTSNQKTSLEIFDAGLGDGSLLISTLRSCHKDFQQFLSCLQKKLVWKM